MISMGKMKAKILDFKPREEYESLELIQQAIDYLELTVATTDGYEYSPYVFQILIEFLKEHELELVDVYETKIIA